MFLVQASNKDQFQFLSKIISFSSKDFIFKRFYYFDTLRSTQEFSRDLLKKNNDIGPTIVLSDIQTSGIGRKRDHWSSLNGGIWISIIINSELKPDDLFLYIVITAISICEMIENETNLKPVLKWPNDIFINGRKISGFLLDSETEQDKINHVILGIGINTNNDLNSTVTDVKNSSRQSYYSITTIKNESGSNVSNLIILSTMLNKLNSFILNLGDSSFKRNILNNYKKRILDSKNQLKYTFKKNDDEFEGEIANIEDDGSILVNNLDDENNKELIKIISSFDVTVKQ